MTEDDLRIEPIPAFQDNYIWLLHRGGPHCVVVDPGDHEPVVAELDRRGAILSGILLTHHHWDHAGGVPDLLAAHDAPVYGPADDRLGDWCQPCREGHEVSVPDLGLNFSVLDIPAHTRSHIAFHGHGVLFSGDTLFSIGCGRLFEGTPSDMQQAMDKLRQLPGETLVYCGHEYTLDNCRFALAVEPDNPTLQARASAAKLLRAQGCVTLPSTLEEEKSANPFLRTSEPSVVAAARRKDPLATAGENTMAVIRQWKDNF